MVNTVNSPANATPVQTAIGNAIISHEEMFSTMIKQMLQEVLSNSQQMQKEAGNE